MNDERQMTEDEFWNGTSRLQYVFDMARATQVPPWGVLGCVLALVSANVPPNIVIPAYVGKQPGSLNCYIALIGESGGGKGLTEGVAKKLIPFPSGIITQPASGESIASLFVRRVPAETGTGERLATRLECWNNSALLDIPEISTLGAAMSRKGSTLLGTLASAWSGEPLGARNKSEADTLEVLRFAYRLVMIAGVQPGNAYIIERESPTGLPQRFLWFVLLDPDCPDAEHVPAPPAGELGFDPAKFDRYRPSEMDLNGLYQNGSIDRYVAENGTPLYPLYELEYPQEAQDWLKRDAVDRLRGTRDATLDGHTPALVFTVAGLLALFEQRDDGMFTVRMDDWLRAQYIVKHSQANRQATLANGRRSRRAARARDKADERLAFEQSADIVEAERLESAKRSVLSQLARHDEQRAGLAGSKIRQLLGRNGPYAYRALNELFAEGKVDKVGADTGEPSSCLWALTSR